MATVKVSFELVNGKTIQREIETVSRKEEIIKVITSDNWYTIGNEVINLNNVTKFSLS